VLWTKPIGSSCLILGEIISLSVDEKIEQFGTKDRLIQLNPPLYFSFKQDEETRKWLFASIGKIHEMTERKDKFEITSETL